jgi:hypothetical protein
MTYTVTLIDFHRGGLAPGRLTRTYARLVDAADAAARKLTPDIYARILDAQGTTVLRLEQSK